MIIEGGPFKLLLKCHGEKLANVHLLQVQLHLLAGSGVRCSGCGFFLLAFVVGIRSFFSRLAWRYFFEFGVPFF